MARLNRRDPPGRSVRLGVLGLPGILALSVLRYRLPYIVTVYSI
jgi:hypothetical protein